MNAERLHSIALALREDIAETEAPALVGQLAQALQQQVQQPNEPSYQQQVSTIRTQLDETLAQAPSNGFSPAWRQALQELGVTDLVGEALRERLRAIFERNEITPSAAADELAVIADRLQTFASALDQLLVGLGFLDVGSEALGPAEFEVGFLIPRKAVDNELERLGKEFVALEHILGPFLELGTGTRPGLEVRSISSSAFQVFLASTPAMALCLAKAVESLVTSYEKILNIRLAHQKMKDGGVPDEALGGVTEHVEGRMKSDIGELAEALLTEFGSDVEAGRANELRLELTLSLNAIANRIDRGYNIDIRAGELPEEATDEAPDAATKEARRVAEIIAEKQSSLQFMNLTGKPILALPETTSNGIPI